MTIDQQIPYNSFFRVDGGIMLPSALALRAYLRMIPQHELDAHVTSHKNDFADWLEHTFNEKAIATKLRKCKSREEMVWILDDAFAELRMQRTLAGKQPSDVGATDKLSGNAVAIPGAPGQGPLSIKQSTASTPQAGNAQPRNADFGAVTADAVVLRDDAAFEPEKQPIIQTNERVSKGYDEIARKMQEALKDTMSKEFEQQIERLRTRAADIAARTSAARKAGKDVLITALVLRQFAPKLAFAVVSRSLTDVQAAIAVLDEAEAELQEANSHEETSVRDEVLKMAALPQPNTGHAKVVGQ